MKLNITRYDAAAERAVWDGFVANSTCPAFLFQRAFMDYHRARFTDASLWIRDEAGQPLAALPANLTADGVLVSHGGLTFGGPLFIHSIDARRRQAVFAAISEFARENDFRAVRFKSPPDYYQQPPSQIDAYALHRLGARLEHVETAFVIDRRSGSALSSRRRRGVREAIKAGVEIVVSQDFEMFWADVLAPNLAERFGAKPVHTIDEIRALARAFPERIKLWSAMRDGEMLAGVVLFINAHVTHAQYISASPAGKACGALDLVLSNALAEFAETTYFSLGTSNTVDGGLNHGLAAWKLEFGASIYTHQTFFLDVRQK